MGITTYIIIAVLLLVAELAYFRIADRFNIIDKPNERSSHSTIVLRGGGVIFVIALWIWALANVVSGFRFQDSGDFSLCYPWFLIAVTLIAGVSFVDDIRSLPDSVRLVAQFAAMALLFWQLVVGSYSFQSCPGETTLLEFVQDGSNWYLTVGLVLIGLVVTVGATNVINFMDGINGITGCYALAVLAPLALVNSSEGFIDQSFLIVMMLAVVVFLIFNFRERGRAKCFAGDVGSIGVGMILLFGIGRLIVATGDVTWLILLLVYGVDGCMTILHRIMLRENLGEAHRKHMYQLMANELGMSHRVVSCIYMAAQLAVSLGFVYGCPAIAETLTLTLTLTHWIYLAACILILCTVYVLFMKKYYHLHEEWLAKRR